MTTWSSRSVPENAEIFARDEKTAKDVLFDLGVRSQWQWLTTKLNAVECSDKGWCFGNG